ncbi:MAG: formyl transferase [Nanohaloarchaea archaeon SW_7_43_1]|nr:MAG: formyl transferase [Nanohaloarchaea archaeon SW_7_43_1]
MQAVFLGMNDGGEKVYNWLNDRNDIEVKALLTEKNQLSLVEDIEPDIMISSGFEHKVPEEIIEVPEQGIVNLHPSFLPHNRGSHPNIWSIIEDTPAGVSIHYMTEEIDGGPIIDRKEVRVEPSDTAGKLYDRLQNEMFELFKENWSDIKEGVKGEEQTGSTTTHYERELGEISELDLDEKVEVGEFLKKLRGLTWKPYKNAYFEKYGEKYFVEVEIIPESEID